MAKKKVQTKKATAVPVTKKKPKAPPPWSPVSKIERRKIESMTADDLAYELAQLTDDPDHWTEFLKQVNHAGETTVLVAMRLLSLVGIKQANKDVAEAIDELSGNAKD